jgi:hypothetical protein
MKKLTAGKDLDCYGQKNQENLILMEILEISKKLLSFYKKKKNVNFGCCD